MSINVQTYNGSMWETVNLTTQRISNFKLQIGYSHPSQLTFTIHQAHHTTPIEPYTPIRFWDDEGDDPDGTPFSSSNPTFIGHVEDVDPGDDGQTINYTCLDPTARASNEIPIMSTAWSSSTADGTGAVPRLVFNSTIDNDDDWVFTRAFEQNVGEMLDLILTDAILPLRRVFAAPESPTSVFDASQLAAMTFELQEKVVFTSEPIRSGVQRLLNDWEPEFRLIWNPGTKQWLFPNLLSSTQATRTLNDFTETYPILQVQIDRSIEGRYSSVKIYGPEALENRDISFSGGGLTDLSDGPTLETYGAGSIVTGINKFQITDTTKRRMGRLLPTPINVPTPEFRLGANAFVQYSVWTRTPVFLARYPATSAGNDVWEAVTGWTFDPINGIIDFKDRYVYRYNNNPAGGDPHYENPIDVRLIYPSYIEPLSTRVPSSGFEGTSYDNYDLENEMKIYDEMLAVGFLYGTPVTSATRIAKFDVLARNILNAKKDVVHVGGMTLEGFDYEFLLLDRRVNIDGVDGNGDALTTGWESINAIVTDVEYDYEEGLTTVQFSSDHAELTARDPSQIKQALKIGASYIYIAINTAVNIQNRWVTTEWGNKILGQDISITGGVTPVIIDPHFGNIDAPIF